MKGLVVDLVLWLLASPVLLVRSLVRGSQRLRFYRLAYTPKILCRNCSEEIWLVGMWQCSACKFTEVGHILRPCKGCGAWPRSVRCYRCNTSTRLPT